MLLRCVMPEERRRVVFVRGAERDAKDVALRMVPELPNPLEGEMALLPRVVLPRRPSRVL